MTSFFEVPGIVVVRVAGYMLEMTFEYPLCRGDRTLIGGRVGEGVGERQLREVIAIVHGED